MGGGILAMLPALAVGSIETIDRAASGLSQIRRRPTGNPEDVAGLKGNSLFPPFVEIYWHFQR